MTIADFDPVSALAGGLLIGLASVLLMILIGRIAGISGIAVGIVRNTSGSSGPANSNDRVWRICFLAGLIAAPVLFAVISGAPVALEITSSMPALLIGGVLVGFGVIVGGGCTSGHGVCGLGRLSVRSLVAVLVFMVSAFIVYNVIQHVFGGLS